MATIEKGQFFLDHKAIKDGQSKAKFFIALTEAELDDEKIVCFVINTEKRMDIYQVLCNRKKQKFVLSPDIHKFSFLENFSSIMLDEPCFYFVNEFYEDGLDLLDDIAEETLCRQINNCIDIGYLLPGFTKLLKENYKNKPKTTSK